MKTPKPVCIDFETFGIEGRPTYPPHPVGVSIKYPGKKAKYYAFAHLINNNCTWNEAAEALAKAWQHPDGVLCQNAKFDVDVAETWFELPALPWDKVHDTMFLLFLDDPHQIELGLKPSAERLLDIAPEERDEVVDWLISQQPVPNIKVSKSKQSDHYAMKYLAFAPGDLVGRYANGDVERTEALFNLLWPKTEQRKMIKSYDRERQLMPILLEMERQGLPVDAERLASDLENYRGWQGAIDIWVRKELRVGEDVNLDSGEQLMKAMIQAKKADEALVPRTPTGKYQTNKEALLLGVTDKVFLAVLKYRTQLKTCLNTFMDPWNATASKSGGLIYTTWNQTKAPSGDASVGTRTGRLSSTPNFQNIPTEFTPIFQHEASDPAKAKMLPRCPFKNLPSLPRVRSYVVPFGGEVLCGRDFSSQELRVLAHFEDGKMRDGYCENPKLDLHQYAAELITKTTGVSISRKDAKTIAFSILYGSGLGKLSQGVGCTVEDAQKLRSAYLNTFPGVKQIQNDLKVRSKQNLPVRTVGGREYFCEPPKVIDGRLREFSYKMLNYIIQGSSADLTKDAVIAFHSMRRSSKILLTVHDEILISVPKNEWKKEMAILRECMNNSNLDVPMISDGETGLSWAEMSECD